MKRFYKKAAAATEDGQSSVLLDGRPIKTPGKAALLLPTPALAGAIAAEWDAQGEEIEPHSMPMMSLASTAIDRVASQRDEIVKQLVRYAETDLLCYRADTPAELVQRQHESWSPLLEWLEETHGAKLLATSGIQPIPQSPDAIEAVRKAVAGVEPFPLAALSNATAITGSVAIGLALYGGRLSGGGAADAACIDEAFQMEIWGADAEAEARLARLRSELEAAARFLTLLD